MASLYFYIYSSVRSLRLVRDRLDFTASLCELIVRILCDDAPEEVDAVYSFSQTTCNEGSQVQKLLEMSLKYKRATILYSGEDGSRQCGWAGYQRFEEKLKLAGISSSRMSMVPFPETEVSINTLKECTALVKFCLSQNIRKILVVAPPFHQVRCTLTLLSCVAKINERSFQVYSAPSLVDDWLKNVHHSQGTLYGTRESLINAELNRIRKYHIKGDLISPDAAMAMLSTR